ncbi:MAG: VTT domain-containing protein [Candidatus Bathyarchaeota archaeon]|nr:MAG: VTT domain-containing protein [Candidatus Bathyarchaeota archaeon]
MYSFAGQYGYLGVFLISVVGTASIVVPIPYALFIYGLATVLDPFLLAVAGGLGSAVGELSGYLFGYYGHRMISKERRRRMEFMIRFLDHYGPIAVFLFALTPLPDDILFIPLGMMRFSFLKVFIPCVLGKTSMCFIVAYSGRYSVEFIRNLFGDGGWLTGIITALLLVTIIVAMLKIDWEKIFEKYVNTGEPDS